MKTLTNELSEVPCTMASCTLNVKYVRLVELEHKAKQLEQATKLISRLRAENKALRRNARICGTL